MERRKEREREREGGRRRGKEGERYRECYQYIRSNLVMKQNGITFI